MVLRLRRYLASSCHSPEGVRFNPETTAVLNFTFSSSHLPEHAWIGLAGLNSLY